MELQGLFASVVHDVPADDAKLEGLFGAVVHDVPPDDARLEGLFGAVVHDVPPDDARLEGLFGSVVHNVPADDARLEGLFASVVHSVPPTAAIVPDITGAPLVPATFDGSASVNVDYYHWTWVSVPGGSAIVNAPIPFPDNQAATPIDMTDNDGLWHFEGDATDDSGAGLNLTLQNAPTFPPGKVGAQSLGLNGTNQYVDTSGADLFPGTTNAVSIAFWQFGAPGLPNNSILWANDAGGNRVINIHMPFGGQIYFDCGNTGASFDRINKVAAAGDYSGSWNHWVFTKDVLAGEMKIYLNGVPWHSGAGLTRTLSTITAFSIGSDGGFSVFFEGDIDEFAIWSRVLSAAEIANIALLQGGTLAGSGVTHTFTPDVVGTYTIQLDVSPTVNTTADAVIAVPPPGGRATTGKHCCEGSSVQRR